MARTGKRYFSTEALEAMRGEYAAGASRTSLAKKYRCSQSTIDKYVEPRMGAELRAAKAKIDTVERQVTALREENRELRAALEASGVS